MKVAVFGASGFVGHNLVNALLKTDIDIIATDFVNSKFPENIEYVKADIRDREDVNQVVDGCDYIIHLAAHPLPASLENPKLNMEVNIGGTLNILDAARKYKIKKVVFSSASSIVGDLQYNPVDEKHPCVPKTPYAVAKYASEHYFRVYQELFGLDYLIFRFFNVYGPKQYPESKALIPMVLNKILKGEEVLVFGDGSAARDFIYVGDVAEFFIKAIQKEDIKNEVVNLGTGKPTTIKEIIELCSEVTGKTPNLVYKDARLGEIANFSADVTKLKKLFGEVPKTSIKDGLEKTYEWFKQNKI